MTTLLDNAEEIFRFEYNPVEGNQRRFRVVISPDTGTLRRLVEVNGPEGWRIVNDQEIDYFEYSDGEEPGPPG